MIRILRNQSHVLNEILSSSSWRSWAKVVVIACRIPATFIHHSLRMARFCHDSSKCSMFSIPQRISLHPTNSLHVGNVTFSISKYAHLLVLMFAISLRSLDLHSGTLSFTNRQHMTFWNGRRRTWWWWAWRDPSIKRNTISYTGVVIKLLDYTGWCIPKWFWITAPLHNSDDSAYVCTEKEVDWPPSASHAQQTTPLYNDRKP